MMSSAPALNVDRKSTYEHEAHERREAIKKEQVDYLGQHPELQPMMKDFMCAALLKRPTVSVCALLPANPRPARMCMGHSLGDISQLDPSGTARMPWCDSATLAVA